MATQTKFVGLGEDSDAVGSDPWGNPGNITADDGLTADCGLTSASTSHYLKGTMAGNEFTIPAGATIDGVTVSVQRSNDGFDVIKDSAVRLVKGGAVVGDNKADTATDWGGVEAVVNYGGASDLWGVALTDADVNASDFGAAFSAASPGGGDSAYVDYISITIHYTLAAATARRMTLLGVG